MEICQRMRFLIILFGGILISMPSCGLRNKKVTPTEQLPESLIDRPISEKEKSSMPISSQPVKKDSLSMADSKPLESALVFYQITPTEITNHVPVRTRLVAFGEPMTQNSVEIMAYPAPTDMDDSKKPISLNQGYFLDRSGFVGPGTRFLDVHYDDYAKIPSDSLHNEWFQQHVIPNDAVQWKWYICKCDTKEESKNVDIINKMINLGLERFQHPDNSTEVHPRFGASLPQGK